MPSSDRRSRGEQPDAHPVPIGVVGLGAIGARLAARLESQDISTISWTRDVSVLASARSRGFRVARSPAAIAGVAEAILVAVTDDSALRAVMEGADGILSRLRPGTIVVNVSTTTPALSIELEARIDALGALSLEAPLIGGQASIESGSTVFLCGGSAAAFSRGVSILSAAGSAELMGPAGSGQLAKAVNQVILAGYYAGVSEGLALASAAGLDIRQTVETLARGTAASWVLSTRGTKMATGSSGPLGRIDLHLKDLRIGLRLAATYGLALPVTSLVALLEGQILREGGDDEGFRALARAFRAGQSSDAERPLGSSSS
jgi:3-hydroxyisobutyrate dehydrogenase-like beta-hydroxyacid dehydrogenase